MSSWSGVSARQWLARADRAHRREDMQDFIERAAAGALVEIAETLEEISNALHKAQHATIPGEVGLIPEKGEQA